MDSHATDQCHDKHACGRREQLRDPFRHREVEAEDSWASARPRTRRSKSPADASRSMSTTPRARSWKFPVSKMKHYLTWWANSMQSRNTLRALGMLRDRPTDHEKAVRESPWAVEGVARVGRKEGPRRQHYEAVRWGNRPK